MKGCPSRLGTVCKDPACRVHFPQNAKRSEDDFTVYIDSGTTIAIKCDFCRERKMLGDGLFIRTIQRFTAEHVCPH